MRVKLTLCIATRRADESPEEFYLRASYASDAVTDAGTKVGRGLIGVISQLKTDGSAGHLELDLRGPAKILCTYINMLILSTHAKMSMEEIRPAKPEPPPPAVEMIVED